MRIGVVYVGQAPRPSVTREIRAVLGDAVEIVERGALDGLDRSEIAALAPEAGESVLFTRLPDDTPVRLSKRAVEARMAERFDRLDADGVDMKILACTGTFDDVPASPSLLRPSLLLDRVVDALRPRRLVVMTPLDEQKPATRAKWAENGYAAEIVALKPVHDAAAAAIAAAEVARLSPDLVVFDCISYDGRIRAEVLGDLPVPSLLAVDLVAHAAAALIRRPART